MANTDWWDDPTIPDEEEDDDVQLREYEISASPNDFNVLTIMSFLQSGNVKIPAFQRNYVWDIKKASKLIESIIIGLPIPQIFLFEEAKNKFLVIDGQQRLMSIYYFIKGRFPRKDKRARLRQIFDKEGQVPDDTLYSKEYFAEFNLRLNDNLPNPLNSKNYNTLGELKSQFDLRTIRNIIIKQNFPTDDHSSMYEIFNRLNSGGVNLGPQEIRASLYHSPFYAMLYRVNADSRWRKATGIEEPDLHMKDIETILRGFALLLYGNLYRPSMTRFLNESSKKLQGCSEEKATYFEKLFTSFLEACSDLQIKPFHGKSGAFTLSIFDAVFAAVCKGPLDRKAFVEQKIDSGRLAGLKEDHAFSEASQSRTAGKGNVRTRLDRATEILSPSL